jgi:YcxB-like protein
MEIEYKLTQEDLMALQRHVRQHRPKSRQNPLVASVIWIGVFVGALMLYELREMFPIPVVDYYCSLLPGVGAGALLTLIVITLHAKRLARSATQRVLQAGRNAEKALGWRRVVIDAKGIYNSAKLFSTTYQWRGIDEVATTDAHVFLYFTTMTAFIVPRRAFPSDRAFDDFVDAARRYHGMAGVGEAVWEMTSDGLWERGGATGIQAPDLSGKSGTVEGIIPKEGL